MRKNFGAKAWLYPQPVLMIATYDENGNPDVMNAAWGGMSDYTQLSICLSEDHKTTQNILKNKCFTVSMADEEHIVACDYVGVVSANKEPNKFEKAGFHASKSEFVNAPVIEELKMCFECKMISYNKDTGILVGEIVNVNADESVLTNGKIDPKKLCPITFDAVNNKYIALGEVVGNAFSDGLKLK